MKKLQDYQNNFIKHVQKAADFSLNSNFMNSIVPISNLSNEKVLDIYNKDYFARLTEALGENFEACWYVLGDDDFFDVCRNYIITYPSNYKDLTSYGDQFPNFLKTSKYIYDFPFLFDLAKFEICFYRLFHQMNRLYNDPFDSTKNLSIAKLKLTDSTYLFSSQWDILSIWNARSNPDLQNEINWDVESNFILYKRNEQNHILSINKNQMSLIKKWILDNTLIHALGELENIIQADEVSDLFFKLKKLNVPLELVEFNQG